MHFLIQNMTPNRTEAAPIMLPHQHQYPPNYIMITGPPTRSIGAQTSNTRSLVCVVVICNAAGGLDAGQISSRRPGCVGGQAADTPRQASTVTSR